MKKISLKKYKKLSSRYRYLQKKYKADKDPCQTTAYTDAYQVLECRNKLNKKTLTSGCAQGTSFGDILENFEEVTLPETKVKTSWL